MGGDSWAEGHGERGAEKKVTDNRSEKEFMQLDEGVCVCVCVCVSQ